MGLLLATRRAVLQIRSNIILRDTYSRADSALTLGSAETGQTYLAPDAGTFGVTSGKAYSVTDANGDLVRVAAAANGTVRATINGTLNSGAVFRAPGLVFRANGRYEYLLATWFGSAIYLYKNDGSGADSFAVLANAGSQTTLDGTDYVLEAQLAGNGIAIYVNGVSKVAHTLSGGNTKYAAYTGIGLRLAKGGSPATAATWDNLEMAA